MLGLILAVYLRIRKSAVVIRSTPLVEAFSGFALELNHLWFLIALGLASPMSDLLEFLGEGTKACCEGLFAGLVSPLLGLP